MPPPSHCYPLSFDDRLVRDREDEGCKEAGKDAADSEPEGELRAFSHGGAECCWRAFASDPRGRLVRRRTASFGCGLPPASIGSDRRCEQNKLLIYKTLIRTTGDLCTVICTDRPRLAYRLLPFNLTDYCLLPTILPQCARNDRAGPDDRPTRSRSPPRNRRDRRHAR